MRFHVSRTFNNFRGPPNKKRLRTTNRVFAISKTEMNKNINEYKFLFFRSTFNRASL